MRKWPVRGAISWTVRQGIPQLIEAARALVSPNIARPSPDRSSIRPHNIIRPFRLAACSNASWKHFRAGLRMRAGILQLPPGQWWMQGRPLLLAYPPDTGRPRPLASRPRIVPRLPRCSSRDIGQRLRRSSRQGTGCRVRAGNPPPRQKGLPFRKKKFRISR
jgi:hypothetical protein